MRLIERVQSSFRPLAFVEGLAAPMLKKFSVPSLQELRAVVVSWEDVGAKSEIHDHLSAMEQILLLVDEGSLRHNGALSAFFAQNKGRFEQISIWKSKNRQTKYVNDLDDDETLHRLFGEAIANLLNVEEIRLYVCRIFVL